MACNIENEMTSGVKLVVIARRIAGRVGPLVQSVYLARPASPWLARHAWEERVIG